MQNKQKTLNLLGLAQKAGKLATGFDAVKISLSKNQAKLIFIGSDVSQNTKDKLAFLMRKKDHLIRAGPSMEPVMCGREHDRQAAS